MDEPRKPAVAPGLPTPLPPGSAPEQRELPANFVPLRLVLRPGGAAVELTRPDMVVGRHTDADIRLSLPDVSRRHCRFAFTAHRWQVFDLNSLNGVFINGDPVKQATIAHGDLIRIGGLTFEADLCTRAPASDVAPVTCMATQANVLRSIADALPRPGQEPSKRRAS